MRNVFPPGRAPACGALLAQLHSLMPSCDMVCGVSCLCSRLRLVGLSCGCFFDCLAVPCMRVYHSFTAAPAVGRQCRRWMIHFFSPFRKKGEALALASIFACIACYLYSSYGLYVPLFVSCCHFAAMFNCAPLACMSLCSSVLESGHAARLRGRLQNELDMCILLWCFQLLFFPVFGCFVAVFCMRALFLSFSLSLCEWASVLLLGAVVVFRACGCVYFFSLQVCLYVFHFFFGIYHDFAQRRW